MSIDVGTSGARATAFDTAGARLLEVRRSYPTRTPRDGWAEQDATSWRDRRRSSALGALISELGPRHTDPRDRPHGPVPVGGPDRSPRHAAAPRAHLSRQPRGRGGRCASTRRSAPTYLAHPDRSRPRRVPRRREDPLDSRARARRLQGDPPLRRTHGAPRADADRRGGHRLDDGRRERAARSPRTARGRRSSSSASVSRCRSCRSRIRRGASSASCARHWCGGSGCRASIPVVAGAGDSIACAFGAGVTSPGPVSEMAGSSTCLNTVVERADP